MHLVLDGMHGVGSTSQLVVREAWVLPPPL